MIAKIRRLWGEMRMMQTARLEPAIREALTREEESGAKALLYFRTALFFVFVLAGVTAPSALKDILTNLAFSFAYAIIVTMQWYLQHQNLHRAMHRFNYFLVVADHALFAGLRSIFLAGSTGLLGLGILRRRRA